MFNCGSSIPLLLGMMPASMWAIVIGVMLLVGICGTQIVVRRRRSTPVRRGLPLSVAAAIFGPLLGLFLGILDVVGSRTLEYPNGQWDYFTRNIFICSAIGVCVAIALAIAVDIPAWLQETPDSVSSPASHETTNRSPS